jgi:hypothetical protein
MADQAEGKPNGQLAEQPGAIPPRKEDGEG